jgi:FkbM family methyltransferase
MQRLKNLTKRILKIHPKSNLTPLKDIIQLGTKVHGYFIPENFLNSSSLCYCVGAGEDISFDTELVHHFGCDVVILDPAPEGINHFNLLKSKIENHESLSLNNLETKFTYRIKKDQLSKLKFIELGVWTEATMIKFYKPNIGDYYVSHSIELFKEHGEYIEVPVDRLSNIMKSQGHTSIDLLKLEIEGAEYKVIETIVEDKLDIKIILVEYDEVYHCKGLDYLKRIKKSSELLLDNGYKIAHSTDMFKRLFVRNDVFEQISAQEKAKKRA